MFIRFLILYLFLNFSVKTLSQEVDSLFALLRNKKIHDTIKLQALTDLNWIYSTQDYEKSKLYATNELKLATKIKSNKWIAQAYNDLGISYHKFGYYDSALVYYKKSLAIRERLHNDELIASSLSKIGVVYQEKGSYKEALQYQLKVLKIYEKNDNKLYTGITLNNIATIHEKLQNSKKAIEFAKRALSYYEKGKDDYSIAQVYGNLGNSLTKLKKYDESNAYYQKALVIFNAVGDLASVSNAENGIGRNFSRQKKYDEALSHYQKALKISDSVQDFSGKVFYIHNISNIYKNLKKYKEAKDMLLSLMENDVNLTDAQRLFLYKQLAAIYGFLNNGKLVDHYIEKYSLLKEKIFNEQEAKEIANFETKYNTEKTKRQLAENQIKLASRQKLLIASGAGLLMLLVVIFFVYRYQRTKRKTQLKEVLLNQELEKTILEKEFGDEKIRIARELHDNIGSHLTFMISSLDNLSYVQQQEKIEKIIDLSNFGRQTMKELRDTIWAMNHDDGDVDQLLTRIAALRSVLPADLEVQIDSNLEKAFMLSGIQLLNLYRIVQEFIQNTIKYADASKVHISFSNENDRINLNLSDNGHGFDISTIHFGNGILNMKRRCEDLYGDFEIHSDSKGTEISCRIPINKKGT